MDYPLHQHYTDKHQENSTTSSNGYRTYQVFNERSTLLFDNDVEEENTRSPNMLQGLNDSWNQHQLHPTYNSNNIQHAQMLNLPHSERGIAGFVSKLYQCLQSVENNQKYARWCQHDGKDMFIIDCIPEFTEFVLPRLFKHCKFPSFVRQLNIYGFQRDTDARKSKVTKDKESCRWYHPCFRPGRRDLFHLIRRKATRYSRKKRAKASVEEDPETILPLGSGDESEIDNDNQNMILLVNNDPNEDQERRLSSASSVTQSMHPVDYTSSTSQLQLGFQEPETSTTNSPNHMHHLPLLQDNTPTITDLTSDNADHTMTVMHHQHHQQQQQQQQQHQEPLMHDQGLQSQIDHIERQYQRMQSNYQKQLNLAHIQINEQKARIQQLETALGVTKHSVKQSTIQQPGGYMSTVCTTIPNSLNENYLQLNHQNSSPRLVTNHRPIYEMQQKPPLNTPRPAYNNNGYYFHQQEVKQEEDTWFHHRNSLSAAIDSNHGMPTAETSTITENIVKAERLKATSPLTVTTNKNNNDNNNDNNNNMNRHASVNSDTSRSNHNHLNGHMNFNNYMLDTYKNTHPI